MKNEKLFLQHVNLVVPNVTLLCSTKSKKKFPEKEKGFRDGQSYSTPQKSEKTRGTAITQPRSHPIKEMLNLGMGWDQGWVMAFHFVTSLFEGWSMTGHP